MERDFHGKETTLSQLSVNTLPQRLFLVSVEKDMMDYCTKALLKLTFFSNTSATFFSFTDAEEEISLILDEKSLQYFRETVGSNVTLVVAPDCWRAIRVDEGANLIDTPGIVANLSAPLKEAGIGMLYLSAYECDLILVQENQIDKAVSCLFNKIFVNEQKEKGGSVEEKSQIAATVIPTSLALASLRNSLESSTYPILQQFFFPTATQNRFFSFFSPASQVSLILERNAIESFPKDALTVHHDSWRAVHVVGEGSFGFSGTHVSLFSSVLASEGISIYYLSTFNTDFILVPEQSVEAAVSCLKRRLGVLFSE